MVEIALTIPASCKSPHEQEPLPLYVVRLQFGEILAKAHLLHEGLDLRIRLPASKRKGPDQNHTAGNAQDIRQGWFPFKVHGNKNN